ncbi:MAG: response regulator [bacterium]
MARILLVDDEDCILRTTAILLEVEGHNTVCVLNGSEALNQLDSAHFDLMLTDIRMGPIDGMELIKRAKSMKPMMPVIVVSAYCTDKTTKEAQDLGAFKFIKKPFKADDIVKSVRDALASCKSG